MHYNTLKNFQLYSKTDTTKLLNNFKWKIKKLMLFLSIQRKFHKIFSDFHASWWVFVIHCVKIIYIFFCSNIRKCFINVVIDEMLWLYELNIVAKWIFFVGTFWKFAHKMIYIIMCQDYNSDVNKWISFVPICFKMIKSRYWNFV